VAIERFGGLEVFSSEEQTAHLSVCTGEIGRGPLVLNQRAQRSISLLHLLLNGWFHPREIGQRDRR
jgi:hypothetical protein